MRILKAGARSSVSFVLNGRPETGEVEPRMLATDFLRQQMGLVGTHVGCEHGVCGACTIRVDGKALRGCLLLAVQLDGCAVETVEGLATADDGLIELQIAFRKYHALQCGFCTPGILMSLSQLLDEEPDAGEERIRDVVSGHICRCTGYQGIMAAAMHVFRSRREAREDNPEENANV